MFSSNSTWTNHLEKVEIDIYSFKKDHKEFIENNKTHQRYKSERPKAFTEAVNKMKKLIKN